MYGNTANGVIHNSFINNTTFILDSVCLLYCINVKTLQSNNRFNMALQCMQFSQSAKRKERKRMI